MAHLGTYYAEKIRAADNEKKDIPKALDHLESIAVGKKQYKSKLLSKGGRADWDLGYENAMKDISLLKEKR